MPFSDLLVGFNIPASGLSAECYGNSVRDDAETAPTFGWSAQRHWHS